MVTPEVYKLYLSDDQGATWLDVSPFAYFPGMTLTQRAMNNQFMSAQSELSFSLTYDPTIQALLQNATTDLYVSLEDVPISGLGYANLGFQSLGTSSGFAPLFRGHIPLTFSRKYNGIANNTIIQLTAKDSLDLLDVPCGDISFRYTIGTPYTICNPYNTTYSIVHQLALIAGFPASRIANVTINLSHPCVAPATEDQSVLSLLDILLHEYGYVLHMDNEDNIRPIKWNYGSTDTPNTFFTEEDIRDNYEESVNPREYYGLETTWYPVEEKASVLLYRDSELPYNDQGAFLGLEISNLPGTNYYPVAANVIDDTTGALQIVEQEYTTDSINYWTNKAVVNKLDINRNAVESDFSDFVATYNHWLEYRAENPAVVLQPESSFGSKKARILFKNTGAQPWDLYYLNIYGTVIYRANARKAKSYIGDDPRKLAKYEARFLENMTDVDAYTERRAAQYAYGNLLTSFSSELDKPVGVLVDVTLEDGTNYKALVLEKVYVIQEYQYQYKLLKYEVDAFDMKQRTISVPPVPSQTSPVRVAVFLGATASIPPGLQVGDWFMPTTNITV